MITSAASQRRCRFRPRELAFNAYPSRGLVFLNNRHYDPVTGVFASVDPLVSMTGEAYVYGSASPVVGSDPTGLETCYSGTSICWDSGDPQPARPTPGGGGGSGGGGPVDPMDGCGGDGVDKVLCGADNLISNGSEGRAYRDDANSVVTDIALALVWAANGDCHEQSSGLIVCVVDNGIDIGFDDIARMLFTDGGNPWLGGVTIADVDIPISFKGGTTYGNVFITKDPRHLKDAELLSHELIHTYQWAAAGSVNYAQLYMREAISSLRQTTVVTFKRKWGIFPYPSVKQGSTGCLNRFEIHSGLSDGNYHDC